MKLIFIPLFLIVSLLITPAYSYTRSICQEGQESNKGAQDNSQEPVKISRAERARLKKEKKEAERRAKERLKKEKKEAKRLKEERERKRKEEEKALKERWKWFVVTSDPPGATIESGGEILGETPFKMKVTSHFFYNGPRFAFSSFIANPMEMTVSKDGYVAKTVLVTRGPYQWVSLNGVNRIAYYVVSQPEFHISLEKVSEFLGSNPLGEDKEQQARSSQKLSTEQIAHLALPAVVQIRTPLGKGSGFFITNTGVIVTNKHVVNSATNVSVQTSKGEVLTATSVFIHPYQDLALIKVEKSDLPYLKFANPKTVSVGADVIAIGSPLGLSNSVTKGIVSSFRNSSLEGILLQTDVAINSGNSGGPLLNDRGQVIGVNTFKVSGASTEGLGFAIFSSEILKMLKEHFDFEPSFEPGGLGDSAKAKQDVRAAVSIKSDPNGAEIFLNGRFVGNTPSKIFVPEGEHTVRIEIKGFIPWERNILVERGSEVNLSPALEKVQTEKNPPD